MSTRSYDASARRGSTSVSVDGAYLNPTVVSSTQLTFTTTAHAAGAVPVRVNTYGGLSDLGPEFTFTATT